MLAIFSFGTGGTVATEVVTVLYVDSETLSISELCPDNTVEATVDDDVVLVRE